MTFAKHSLYCLIFLNKSLCCFKKSPDLAPVVKKKIYQKFIKFWYFDLISFDLFINSQFESNMIVLTSKLVSFLLGFHMIPLCTISHRLLSINYCTDGFFFDIVVHFIKEIKSFPFHYIYFFATLDAIIVSSLDSCCWWWCA